MVCSLSVPRLSPRGTRVLARLAVTMLLGSGLAACHETKRDVVEAPLPVQAMTVQLAPREQTATYVGTVRPRFESDLGFRVAGKIVERLFNVGDRVSPGQILARLDGIDLRLSQQSQEAELRAAQSARDQAAAAEDRAKALIAKGIVARATVDQRQAAADEARARVDRAERALSLARNQLGYAELRADAAGVVSALPVEVGQVVTAGQLVVRIARLDTLEAQVDVPENATGSLKDSIASVSTWGSDVVLPAKLRELSPVADRVSRSYQARYAIETRDDSVRMGQTVALRLRRPGAGDVAHLPLSAVMNDSAGASVWVVDAGGERVRKAPVEVLSFEAQGAVIGGGLKDGDRIVTLGVHMLDEGRAVRVVELRADR